MVECYLNKLKELQEDGNIVTRLYFKGGMVEDYSYFTNTDYMSDSLLDALKNGKTLTNKQTRELEQFKIEMVIQ